jgi:hypothetical protein
LEGECCVKLYPLVPLEEIADPKHGVCIQITHVGQGPNGLPRARMMVWNGKPLAGNVIAPDSAKERRELAEAAATTDPEAVPDVKPILDALLRCAAAIHELDELKHQPDQGDAEGEAQLAAAFPGLVDLVDGEDGELSFLLVGESGVEVAQGHVPRAARRPDCA